MRSVLAQEEGQWQQADLRFRLQRNIQKFSLNHSAPEVHHHHA